MKVIVAPRARADLTDIGNHIAIDNPCAAAHETDRLLSAVLSLAEQPQAWPLIGRDDIRKRPVGAYLIFYRVSADVEIVRILHSARDWLSLL